MSSSRNRLPSPQPRSSTLVAPASRRAASTACTRCSPSRSGGFETLLVLLASLGGDFRSDSAVIRQPVQRLAHQAALALQVPGGDQLLLWMIAQPARTEP